MKTGEFSKNFQISQINRFLLVSAEMPENPTMNRMNGYETKRRTCTMWSSHGFCTLGPSCNWLHAFVDPGKDGICPEHRRDGNCPRKNRCWFQHLPFSIDKYERIAEGTRSFDELKDKVYTKTRLELVSEVCRPVHMYKTQTCTCTGDSTWATLK